jgi:transposase
VITFGQEEAPALALRSPGRAFPRALIPGTGAVTERLRVREIDDDEGRRLVRIIRRGSGSVVTWRRAQMVLLSARGMDVPAIAKVAFTSEDRVRDVIGNFSADGFGSLYPKDKGGRPPKFTLARRREIRKIAKAKPAEYDLPFSTWSLAKPADFVVAEGVAGRHQPRGPAGAAPRGGRHLSADKDLEVLQGPALRGEEGPDRAPVRDRRPRGDPGGRRP